MKIFERIAEISLSIIVCVISTAVIVACVYGFIILGVNTLQGFLALLRDGEITSQLIISVTIIGTILGISVFVFECVLSDE